MLSIFFDFAYAAGGTQGEGIPWKMVLTQIGNFTVYVLLLGFLLRGKVRDYFQGKKKTFEEQLKKAEEAKRQAELKQKEVLEKIEDLEKGFQSSLEKAKEQAEKERQKIIEDTKLTAEAIKKESERTYQSQLNEAIQNLKTELLEEALKKAENQIQSKMQKQDHENLQENLVKSFGAVK